MIQEYCSKCGAKCIVTEFTDKYSSDTGQPILEYKIKCPNWTWLSVLWDAHTNYATNDEE